MLQARRTTGAFIFFPMDEPSDTLQPFSSNIYCHFFGGFFLFSLPCGFLFFPALQQHLFNNRLATRFNSLGNTCPSRPERSLVATFVRPPIDQHIDQTMFKLRGRHRPRGPTFCEQNFSNSEEEKEDLHLFKGG